MTQNRIQSLTPATRANSTTQVDGKPSLVRRIAFMVAWASVGGALSLSCPFWPVELRAACDYAAKVWDVVGGLIGG